MALEKVSKVVREKVWEENVRSSKNPTLFIENIREFSAFCQAGKIFVAETGLNGLLACYKVIFYVGQDKKLTKIFQSNSFPSDYQMTEKLVFMENFVGKKLSELKDAAEKFRQENPELWVNVYPVAVGTAAWYSGEIPFPIQIV